MKKTLYILLFFCSLLQAQHNLMYEASRQQFLNQGNPLNLMPEGYFNEGDLSQFDEANAQFSVNGSNQLAFTSNGTNQFLGKNFAYTHNATYTISYDVLSSNLDGGISFSSASMFGGTVLPITVGHHDVEKVATNASSTMAFRIAVLAANTSGTQIVIDNIEIVELVPINIVQNGTFDDATDITLGAAWNVSGGALNYASGSINYTNFALSENIVNGVTYDVEYEITTIQSGKWAVIELSTNSGETTVNAYTNYTSPQTVSFSYTHSGADSNILSLEARNFSGGGTFSIDNLSIIEQ